MSKLIRFLPLLMLGILATALFMRLMQTYAPEPVQAAYHDPMLGKPMPALELPPLHEKDAPLHLAHRKGKPYLFNVFASWCAACQIEHAHLKTLKDKTGLPLYGMAWKDDPTKTKAWLDRMGNFYDAVGTDPASAAALELGLTGAPETYLIDANGIIIALYRGALSEAVIETRFLPALRHPAQDITP